MHEYDAVLKVLLQASSNSILEQLAGIHVTTWLSTEMPKVQTRRADLLGETADGRLVHVELQSTNYRHMALRMAEYAIRIYRKLGRYPKQIVLYVGEAPMRMSTSVREPEFTFQYKLVDIRDIDGDLLLASGHISDNLLAILTNLPDGAATVRLVLRRIANLHEEARRDAFARLLLLSGLRHLEPTVKEEAEKMPILNDIMDHQVLGPAIRQGREEGRQEGLQEGLQKGLQKGSHEGRQKMIRRLINKRFGTIPARVERRLRNMSTEELDEAAMRILEATSIEDVFSS